MLTPEQFAENTRNLLIPYIGEGSRLNAFVEQQYLGIKGMLQRGVIDIALLTKLGDAILALRKELVRKEVLDNLPHFKQIIIETIKQYLPAEDDHVNLAEQIMVNLEQLLGNRNSNDKSSYDISKELGEQLYQALKGHPNRIKDIGHFDKFSLENPIRKFLDGYDNKFEECIDDKIIGWIEETLKPLQETIERQAEAHESIENEILEKIEAAAKTVQGGFWKRLQQVQTVQTSFLSNPVHITDDTLGRITEMRYIAQKAHEAAVNQAMDIAFAEWCQGKSPDVIEAIHFPLLKSRCMLGLGLDVAVSSLQTATPKIQKMSEFHDKPLELDEKEVENEREKLGRFLQRAHSSNLEILIDERTKDYPLADLDERDKIRNCRDFINRLQGMRIIDAFQELGSKDFSAFCNDPRVKKWQPAECEARILGSCHKITCVS